MLPHSLNTLPQVERFYSYPVIVSTNDAARSLTEFPSKGIFVIQADRQTAGRGRRGDCFFSDNEGGLWASILTPVSSIDAHFSHNRALSMALCDAIESITGKTISCSIKWPNDIYIGHRKVCGILLENHPLRNDMLVIGFGINVSIKRTDFPPALQMTATSLFIETEKRFSRSQLLKAIINRYQTNLTIDLSALHRSYVDRLYGVGRPIEVDDKSGIYQGVEIDGRLRLLRGREVIYLMSGHVRFIDSSPERDSGDV